MCVICTFSAIFFLFESSRIVNKSLKTDWVAYNYVQSELDELIMTSGQIIGVAQCIELNWITKINNAVCLLLLLMMNNINRSFLNHELFREDSITHFSFDNFRLNQRR